MTASAVEHATGRQFLSRDVNERIAELSASVASGGASLFVCECGREQCAEAVELTLLQYARVRAARTRFLVVEGHELDQLERVVERHAHYVVVERRAQRGGLARTIDRQTDGASTRRRELV